MMQAVGLRVSLGLIPGGVAPGWYERRLWRLVRVAKYQSPCWTCHYRTIDNVRHVVYNVFAMEIVKRARESDNRVTDREVRQVWCVPEPRILRAVLGLDGGDEGEQGTEIKVDQTGSKWIKP
jgi:hypothetical protein